MLFLVRARRELSLSQTQQNGEESEQADAYQQDCGRLPDRIPSCLMPAIVAKDPLSR
jgi:hypothetical protein